MFDVKELSAKLNELSIHMQTRHPVPGLVKSEDKKDVIRSKASNEYYDDMSEDLTDILVVLRALKRSEPEQVHHYLKHLSYYVTAIAALKRPFSVANSNFEKLQEACRAAKSFLDSYEYKLGDMYRHNTAILLTCLLYESTRSSTKPNIEVDVPIIQNNKTGVTYDLKTIAAKVVKATKVGARNIQFIAIGIGHDGGLWITSNKHSPAVYPFECFMDGSLYNKAKQVKTKWVREKSEYKVAGKSALTESPVIHAETMMAAIPGIEQIIIVDGSGNKIENCPCCAHYLCSKGYTSSAHIEAFENYIEPTDAQIRATVELANILQTSYGNNTYKSILPKESAAAYKCSKTAKGEAREYLDSMLFLLLYTTYDTSRPVEAVFDEVKAAYPTTLSDSTASKLSGTYHLGLKLASPEDKSIDRSYVYADARRSNRHLNKALTFYDDGSLKESSKRGDRALSPVRSSSPRSKALAERANLWMATGDGSARFIEKDKKMVIELTRK